MKCVRNEIAYTEDKILDTQILVISLTNSVTLLRVYKLYVCSQYLASFQTLKSWE